MASPPQFVLDFPQGRSHAVASRMPSKQEGSASRAPTDERESQTVEGLRFALPVTLPPFNRVTTELQQPGLVPMQFERELLKPDPHRIPEASRFGFVLEAHDQIVGVTHHDHVALRFASPPLLRPQIEHVVQVDVSQQRREHSPNAKGNFGRLGFPGPCRGYVSHCPAGA